jgi:putative membrane protein
MVRRARCSLWNGGVLMMWDRSDYWYHGASVGGWLMFGGMVLVIVAVVLLVVYLVRQTAHPAGAGAGTGQAAPALPPAPETPREILRRRYAGGEIEREDYLQRLSDLGG